MDITKLADEFAKKSEDTIKNLVKENNNELESSINSLKDEILLLKQNISKDDKVSDKNIRKNILTDAFKMVASGKAEKLSDAINIVWDDFLNETNAWEGKELVLKEFALEILQRMKELQPIKVREYTTSTNNKTIRAYDNWSITQYVAPWNAPTFSKGSTKDIDFVVNDAVTAVKVENNLLDDVEETYNIIVRDIAESQAYFKNVQIFMWDGVGLNRVWVLEDARITEVETWANSLESLTDIELDDLLDRIILALPADAEGEAEFYVSKYEYARLLRARDVNWNKLYPEIAASKENKMLKGYKLNVRTNNEKVIINSATDVADARGILLANFAKWYAEITRRDFDIESMYINDDQAKRVRTLLATWRHTWWVIIPEFFVVSVNK